MVLLNTKLDRENSCKLGTLDAKNLTCIFHFCFGRQGCAGYTEFICRSRIQLLYLILTDACSFEQSDLRWNMCWEGSNLKGISVLRCQTATDFFNKALMKRKGIIPSGIHDFALFSSLEPKRPPTRSAKSAKISKKHLFRKCKGLFRGCQSFS